MVFVVDGPVVQRAPIQDSRGYFHVVAHGVLTVGEEVIRVYEKEDYKKDHLVAPVQLVIPFSEVRKIKARKIISRRRNYQAGRIVFTGEFDIQRGVESIEIKHHPVEYRRLKSKLLEHLE